MVMAVQGTSLDEEAAWVSEKVVVMVVPEVSVPETVMVAVLAVAAPLPLNCIRTIGVTPLMSI